MADVVVEVYSTPDEITAYHDTRRTRDEWRAIASPTQGLLSIEATRYIDDRWRGKWKGRRFDQDQLLAWPRSGVYDEDGYLVDHTIKPQRVKDAAALIALEVSRLPAGTLDLEPSVRGLDSQDIERRSVQIGPLRRDVTYRSSSTRTAPIFPEVERLLSGYLDISTGSVRLIRG
jgi:hypothetical protein